MRQGTSTPDQFVRTKLSQLEVPEAFRTTRFSAGPGISGEVNLAFRFESSMGFFIPVRFFVSRSIGFHSVSRAGEHISWLAERVNRKLHIFCFSPHRRFRRSASAPAFTFRRLPLLPHLALFGAFDRSEFLHRNSRIKLSKISGSFCFRATKNPTRSPTFGLRSGGRFHASAPISLSGQS